MDEELAIVLVPGTILLTECARTNHRRIYVVYDVCTHHQKLAVPPKCVAVLASYLVSLEYDRRFHARLSDQSVTAVAFPDWDDWARFCSVS